MKSLWNDEEAAGFQGELGLRVYTSRLLGREPSLVLHGGGNTSVKIREKNILGREEDLLYVKGSGWDLEKIESGGFSPVRLQHLIDLAGLESLSDLQMVNELRTHMTVSSAPTPSVEAILHAILPAKYVDHTHADAVISITNTKGGHQRINEIFKDLVVVIPYIMPGFDLARLCAQIFPAEASVNTIGMVLMNHGIFSFGDSARTSYERMIELVTMAEEYLNLHKSWHIGISDDSYRQKQVRTDIASLRLNASRAAGFPILLSTYTDPQCMNFINNHKIGKISQQGPATPDHVIRTKRIPLIGRDIDGYTKDYEHYFAENNKRTKDEKSMLDPVPRVILDKELGLCTLGRSAKDAAIVADIYRHTIDIILRSEMLGGYQALPASDIFDVEYWELEQAKLRKSGKPPVYSGEVALVTGAASGIGKACVHALMSRGAAVVGLDIDDSIEHMIDMPAFKGVRCDLTDESQIIDALEQGVRVYGGLDMLVLNAGTFPPSCRIDSLQTSEWRKVQTINLDANLAMLRECYPLFRLSPNHARIVIIGSKNVTAPGPGAVAYSASKAALNQLARIAALEWGEEGIRINTVHPDAVFDTGIWTEQVLASRAKSYGLSVEDYKKKNILHVEIKSSDVAELVAELCGPLFAATTGAQIPVDGGNDRVI